MNKRQYKKHMGKYGLTYREIKESCRAQEKYWAERNRKFRTTKQEKLFGLLSEVEKDLIEMGMYTIEELTACYPQKYRHRAITKVLDRKGR